MLYKTLLLQHSLAAHPGPPILAVSYFAALALIVAAKPRITRAAADLYNLAQFYLLFDEINGYRNAHTCTQTINSMSSNHVP